MREGFTTGSCAAAAALASCLWQRDGECPARVEIVVPEGRAFAPTILEREPYTCGVTKDAGDDPDITNGCEICARVELADVNGAITFHAGAGVGVVTLPGLKLPVGEAAINPVPRSMIERAVRSVFPSRAASVTVSVVGGEALACKTFNPRLGVVGGLSVLGTSGIVRPMSEEALTETIALELSVRHKNGTVIGLTFGKQGEEALHKLAPHLPIAQMSNFVGFSLDEAAKLQFERVLLAGHPGKLAKVAAGVMQTHSKYGDARREAILAQLMLMGADDDLGRRIYACTTTDAAITILRGTRFADVWNRMADAAQAYCEERVQRAVEIDVLYLDGTGEIIGRSERIRRDKDRWQMR